MNTAPRQYFPNQAWFGRPFYQVWIPVLLGVTVICCESQAVFGGSNTGRWLSQVWPAILGKVNTPFFGEIHHTLRKIGHVTGYGTLGLLFLQAWRRSVRIYMKMMGTRLGVAATMLAVSFTFLIGSLDEWHQSFIPGRTSTSTDVLIDTSGALLFNLIFWLSRYLHRRSLLNNRVKRRSSLTPDYL